MRPYRFKMRLSSNRLNVTRLGRGPAAAIRAAARASLGSVSSDIELMERLLSSQRVILFFQSRFHVRLGGAPGRHHVSHDRANRAWPQGALPACSAVERGWAGISWCTGRAVTRGQGLKTWRNAIVSRVIMPPNFRPPT